MSASGCVRKVAVDGGMLRGGSREELLGFKRGEVLVCDALSPTMTFVIPLASAVVERRGGMLIHGAIIARLKPGLTSPADSANLPSGKHYFISVRAACVSAV